MLTAYYFVLTALPLGIHGIRTRQVDSTFQLYAYGNELGGLPVFYADGFANAGDPNLSNSTQAAAVTLSTTSDRVWRGSPNTTNLDSSKSPTWSNVTFYIPSTNSTSSRVGFSNTSGITDTTTSGFFFYGNTAMFAGDNGVMMSSWTGLKGEDGVFKLYWNDTSAGQVPITLRRIAPSRPPPPAQTTHV